MKVFLYLLMALLLVGTAGAAVLFTNPELVPAAVKGPPPAPAADPDAPPPYVSAVGFVKTEGGPIELRVQQEGRVVEVAQTRASDGKDRLFREGEVILRVDDAAARHRVSKADAAVKAAQAELDRARKAPEKHALEQKQQHAVIAAYEAERAKLEAEKRSKVKLFRENVGENVKNIIAAFDEALKVIDEKIKVEELKLDQLQLVDPQTDIARARADVQARQADLKLAQLALEHTALKAPRDGTVLRVYVDKGESVGPQAPAVEFAPNTPRVVKAEVLQEWAHLIHVGQEAIIEDDTHRGPRWEGRVQSVADWIAPKRSRIIEPFMTNDVRTLETTLEFTGGDTPVRIGQRVRVKIKVKDRDTAAAK